MEQWIFQNPRAPATDRNIPTMSNNIMQDGIQTVVQSTHTTTTNWQAYIGRDGHITPAKRVTRASPDNSVPLGSQLKAPSEGNAMSGDTIKGHENAPEPASLHHRTRRGAILKQMDRLTIHRIRDISPCLLPTTGPPMTTCPNRAAPRPHLRPSPGGAPSRKKCRNKRYHIRIWPHTPSSRDITRRKRSTDTFAEPRLNYLKTVNINLTKYATPQQT